MKMLSKFAPLFVFALLVGSAAAEERFRLQLKADLNGDGRKETIRLVPYKVGQTEMGQLVVEDPNGTVLWRSPKCKQQFSEEPFQFLGEFDRGDLECTFDFDGDGRPELVATGQKSDVRPTVFLVYRWNGKAFQLHKEGMLVAADDKDKSFAFKSFDPAAVAWVERIHQKGPGRYLLDYSKLGENPGNLKVPVQWNATAQKFTSTK